MKIHRLFMLRQQKRFIKQTEDIYISYRESSETHRKLSSEFISAPTFLQPMKYALFVHAAISGSLLCFLA